MRARKYLEGPNLTVSMETESAASLPNDLLRFLPTLLTIVVLGGAGLVAGFVVVVPAR